MSALMDTLGITKQGKTTWVAQKLLTVLLMMLIVVLVTTADNLIIGQSVSARWLPLVGLVLGIGLTGLVFREITFLRDLRRHSPVDEKETGADKEKKKVVLLTRRWLFFFGIVFIGVHNSIALVFNVHWLHTFGLGLGLSFVCIGWWMSTLFWEQFKGDWMWWLLGLLFHISVLVNLFQIRI
ncbi:hypothetical protein F4212_05800 [Candidatus Poribacteria bacterium]|nr:hypothetical protein [Candidatus Poribacteria bacterium]